MNRNPNSQENFEAYCDEIKAWLRSLVGFPRRVPQRMLARVAEVDDSTLCMYLSEKYPTNVPKTWSLLQVAATTGTQVQLFEILGRYAQMDENTCAGAFEGLSMLQENAEAFGRLTAGIAHDLNDDDSPLKITKEEAVSRLPDALRAQNAANKTVNVLLALAQGGAR